MTVPKTKKDAFCLWYLALGNAEEAAKRIGIPPPQAGETGLALLREESCRRRLAALAREPALPLRSLVISGLARLAFGPANDAVLLAFSDDAPTPETLAALDLFHIAELKRGKGSSAIEIKFCDRQRAMEKLLECAGEAASASAAEALLQALGGGDLIDGSGTDRLFTEAADGGELVAE